MNHSHSPRRWNVSAACFAGVFAALLCARVGAQNTVGTLSNFDVFTTPVRSVTASRSSWTE
jgi:hypothetical protein